MKPEAIQKIRNVVFDAAVAFVTIPFGLILGLAGFALPLKTRFWLVKCWRRCFTFFERYILGIRVEVVGLENIPKEACIVISNHQSAWETVGLQTLFSPCVFVLKEELLKIPFFGWGLKAVKMIAIDRESSKQALKKVTEQGLDRIHSGITVVVFPEGTRADPGESLPFQIGGAYLASKCNAPVVPVAHNAGTVWPKGASVKGPGVIRVVIGEPIMPGLRAQALNDRVETWIRAQNTTSETLLG
jgi:1-acyl-sn-glycerol-3-phosphate acyltransferase